MKTLQDALKALYYSLGGNADNVRETDDLITIINAIAALNIAKEIKTAVELPDIPDDGGTYTLQVVIDDGVATFSWDAVSDGT